MADVIFTSIKKILTDANLPLTLKFDNDKSQVSTYQGVVAQDNPQGTIMIEIINANTYRPFSQDITGYSFSDIKGNVYTVTNYTNRTATLDKPTLIDILSSDVIFLTINLNLDELLVTFQSSSVVTDRAITNKIRKVVESYDLELAVYDDVTGSKSNELIKKVSKLFSNQSYCSYDENGLKIGKNFFLALTPSFSRRDGTDLSRSYIGRVRFWKYENYNDI